MRARVATLLIACAGSLHAQTSETGLVRGHVLDKERRPLAGVQLSVARPDGSYRRTAMSDNAGSYFLSLLPPGDYTVQARRVGLQPITVTEVRVEAGGVRVLDLSMTAAAAELAPIVVRSEGQIEIRRGDTESNTKVNALELAKLPVGYELARVVALTPGARPDQLWGGASVQANGYQLDGLAFNHPGLGGVLLEPSLSWIEEVEVRGLGAGAQYGAFQGGLVNVVTKSGTNTRQGSVRGFLESNSESQSNLTTTEVVPEVADRRLIEGEIRGPIVSDKLFYFAAASLLTTDQRALDHLKIASGSRFSPLQQSERELRFLAKTTWNASPSDLVNVMLSHTRADADHFGLSGRETAEATLTRRAPATLGSATWQHAFGKDSYFDARLLVHAADDRRTPANGGAVPAIQTYQLALFRQFQNALFTDRFAPRTTAASVSWRRAFDEGGWTEKFRAGADASAGSFFEQHLRNGSLTWRPRFSGSTSAFNPTNASTWDTSPVALPSSWGGEARLSASVLNSALWLEDEFVAGRLTMIRGIRFGAFGGKIASAGGGERKRVWQNTAWDPRVGVVFDLSRPFNRDLAPTFAVKAHWGRIHQHLFAEMFDRAAGSSVYTDQELWEYRKAMFADPRTSFTRAERDSLATLGQFTLMERSSLSQSGPLIKVRQPYVDQTVLGVEKAVGSRWKAEALFVYRTNRDAVALVDRNRDKNYTVVDSVRVFDALLQPVAGPKGTQLVIPKLYIRNDGLLFALRNFLITPPAWLSAQQNAALSYQPDFVLENVDDLHREFRQVQLNLSAVYPSWSGVFSATWTDLWGNQSSVAGYDDQAIYGRDDVAGRGPGMFVRANEATNSYGRLENFTPWEAKVRVSGSLPFGFSGGAYLQHRYGDRTAATFTMKRLGFNYVGRRSIDSVSPLLITPITGERIYIDQRGSRHYADNTLLDLKLERGIPARKGIKWKVGVEVFNVFGVREATLVNTALDSQVDPNSTSRFAAVLGRVPPRTFRLGSSLEL